MRRNCFSLACVLVIFFGLMSDGFLAYDGRTSNKNQNDRLAQKSELNDPIYMSHIGAVSPKILSRHKRIKKSVSTMKSPSERFVTLEDLKSVRMLGEKKMNVHPYAKTFVSAKHDAHPSNKKKPMTSVKRDPFISRVAKPASSSKKLKMNLKVGKAGRTEYPKKFKRSLSYGDFSGYDFRTERQDQKMPSRYFKSNRRIKMKGGDKFFSLAEAKNELDRRRRLIRKLEKQINYRKKGLAKYAIRPYYSDRDHFLRPTIESTRDKLPTQSLVQLNDPKTHKPFNFDRHSPSEAVKIKAKKGNIAKKTTKSN